MSDPRHIIGGDSAGTQYQLKQVDALAGLRSLPNDSIDLIVTDPPYSGMNQHLKLGKGRIVGDYEKRGEKEGTWFAEFEDSPEVYREFLTECKRVMKPDTHMFIMFDSYSLLTLGPVVREVLDVKNLIVWDKVNIGMGHYFRRRHEYIMFASKGKKPLTRKNIPDVWEIKRIHKAQYPTEKPVELFQTMIDASLPKGAGALVLDPFCGSGAAGVAALREGQKFYGFDISDKSMELTRSRLLEVPT